MFNFVLSCTATVGEVLDTSIYDPLKISMLANFVTKYCIRNIQIW